MFVPTSTLPKLISPTPMKLLKEFIAISTFSKIELIVLFMLSLRFLTPLATKVTALKKLSLTAFTTKIKLEPIN